MMSKASIVAVVFSTYDMAAVSAPVESPAPCPGVGAAVSFPVSAAFTGTSLLLLHLHMTGLQILVV